MTKTKSYKHLIGMEYGFKSYNERIGGRMVKTHGQQCIVTEANAVFVRVKNTRKGEYTIKTETAQAIYDSHQEAAALLAMKQEKARVAGSI